MSSSDSHPHSDTHSEPRADRQTAPRLFGLTPASQYRIAAWGTALLGGAGMLVGAAIARPWYLLGAVLTVGWGRLGSVGATRRACYGAAGGAVVAALLYAVPQYWSWMRIAVAVCELSAVLFLLAHVSERAE